ncbi:hypothetical protein QYF36_013034 [Acer negundo]|nr:hypothetical protein QYF36_013034 [Acer negundo]
MDIEQRQAELIDDFIKQASTLALVIVEATLHRLYLTDKFSNAQIICTRDSKGLDELDAVLDVGGVYDPSNDRKMMKNLWDPACNEKKNI